MATKTSFCPLTNGSLSRTARLRAGLARAGSLVFLSIGLTLLLSCGQEKPASEPKEVRVGELRESDLPTEEGKSLAIGLPGLSSGAKKLELVLVPGLGSVKPFFMGRYEVTQGQYEALMRKNPSGFKRGPDFPVEQVNWDEAKEFCRRLTAGLPDKLKGKFVFRLPTDAEWSVAVGLPQESGSTPGEKSTIKDVYPWGTAWPPPSGAGNYCDESTKGKYGSLIKGAESSKGWYGSLIKGYDDGYAETAPVGSFKANKYGLYDLGGNVWEWCEDFYFGKSGSRVLRGASWGDWIPSILLSSIRDYNSPSHRGPGIGFRVVLVSESSP